MRHERPAISTTVRAATLGPARARTPVPTSPSPPAYRGTQCRWARLLPGWVRTGVYDGPARSARERIIGRRRRRASGPRDLRRHADPCSNRGVEFGVGDRRVRRMAQRRHPAPGEVLPLGWNTVPNHQRSSVLFDGPRRRYPAISCIPMPRTGPGRWLTTAPLATKLTWADRRAIPGNRRERAAVATVIPKSR